MARAGFPADRKIIDRPAMPASFQNRRIKAFSLGDEHTLALDRRGQHACLLLFGSPRHNNNTEFI